MKVFFKYLLFNNYYYVYVLDSYFYVLIIIIIQYVSVIKSVPKTENELYTKACLYVLGFWNAFLSLM